MQCGIGQRQSSASYCLVIQSRLFCKLSFLLSLPICIPMPQAWSIYLEEQLHYEQKEYFSLATSHSVAISQVLNYSVCTEVDTVMGPYMKYVVIYPTLFDLLLLVLALIPTVKETTVMYKATKRWQPNRYMSLIVKEGVFYVLLNLLNNIPNAILDTDRDTFPPVWYLISFLFYVATMFPVMPRFVLSIWELYANDTLRYCGGLDSGFGIPSHVRNIVGQDTSVSGIVFTGGRSGRGEWRRTWTHWGIE